jgi:hypothetical protein
MKKILLVTALLSLTQAAFSQGVINFDNRANVGGSHSEAPGAVIAPFYNVDPANTSQRKVGNTATGDPVGTQTYGGSLLFGTGYTATLWALDSANVTGTADLLGNGNNLALVGTTTMRTSTSGNNAGRVATPTVNPIVPDVIPNGTERATFQVRVWDNRSGQFGTWDLALAAARSGQIAIGYSDLFTVPFALTDVASANTPASLQGLTSFQLFIVPEPSVIALGVLGAGCLFLLRRRK